MFLALHDLCLSTHHPQTLVDRGLNIAIPKETHQNVVRCEKQNIFALYFNFLLEIYVLPLLLKKLF